MATRTSNLTGSGSPRLDRRKAVYAFTTHSSLATPPPNAAPILFTATIAFADADSDRGRCRDRLGAKRIFTLGFAIFVLASLACALARSIGFLIAVRAIQGLGVAILVLCALAVLDHAYTQDQESTHAIGIWAAGASVALAAGPVIGGSIDRNRRVAQHLPY